MRSIALSIAALAAFPGCAQINGLRDVTLDGHYVGGELHGLWDGTSGVVLRLHSDWVDTRLTVTTSGRFQFTDRAAVADPYTVTVETQPAEHTCVVTGDRGVVNEADVASVSVDCTGPAVAIDLSGGLRWTFDAKQDSQTFAGSIVTQEVTLTIRGATLINARVRGAEVALDEPTAPFALSLGSTTLPVALATRGGLSKTYQLVFERGAQLLEQVTYGKASNRDGGDHFGISVAVDGDTLAVGAYREDSNASDINGDQSNNSAKEAGAVYVFVRAGATWMQQAYIKAWNPGGSPDGSLPGDYFGYSVALSGDTLAVGAYNEDSAATGVHADPKVTAADNNAAADSGAVYVFVRKGVSWTQQSYLKPPKLSAASPDPGDHFGASIALAGDTLAVGAPSEDSDSRSAPESNTAVDAGAVYVFSRNDTAWTQQDYVKPDTVVPGSHFGSSVALAGDRLVVGAPDEASSAGAAYVFRRAGSAWTQEQRLEALDRHDDDDFGTSVALSGHWLAVGAPDHAASGAVYLFADTSGMWIQMDVIEASNADAGDEFGASLALSGDVLAVGAPRERSRACGVGGGQDAQSDNTLEEAGAAYVFIRRESTWTQELYVKASNTNPLPIQDGDNFGNAVALSGNALVIGARDEASGSVIDQADNSKNDAGAIYVFR